MEKINGPPIGVTDSDASIRSKRMVATLACDENLSGVLYLDRELALRVDENDCVCNLYNRDLKTRNSQSVNHPILNASGQVAARKFWSRLKRFEELDQRRNLFFIQRFADEVFGAMIFCQNLFETLGFTRM